MLIFSHNIDLNHNLCCLLNSCIQTGTNYQCQDTVYSYTENLTKSVCCSSNWNHCTCCRPTKAWPITTSGILKPRVQAVVAASCSQLILLAEKMFSVSSLFLLQLILILTLLKVFFVTFARCRQHVSRDQTVSQ